MAAVLLSNTRTWITTLQLGRHFLNSLFDFPPLRPAMAINPSRLAAYAGRYDLTPLNKLELIARDGYLVVKPSDQKELETNLFPESDTRFFTQETDATATFEVRQDGSVSHLETRSGNTSIKVSLAAGNGKQRPAGAYVAGQPGAGHQAPAKGAVHGELPVRQAPQLSPRPAPPPVARLCSSVSLLRCRSQTSPGQPFGPTSAQSYNRPQYAASQGWDPNRTP
jgi:hypothetical protein